MKISLTRYLLDRIEVDRTTGCWNWVGGLNCNGYGRAKQTDITTSRLAHRISFVVHKGDIPEPLVLDHLCRNKRCINPDHLEVVTRGENTLRGDTIASRNKAKTHCVNGHEYDLLNTRISPQGFRECRQCDKEKHLLQRASRKAIE